MTVVINKRFLGGSSLDPVVDFDDEIQIMDDDLTQRNGCTVAAITSHVAAEIVEVATTHG